LKDDRIISRKGFVALIGYAIIILFSGLWSSLSRRTGELSKATTITFPLTGLSSGVTIANGVIIIKTSDEIRVFLSRCTHLGCALQMCGTDRLICPCHGSEFSAATGNVIKGPASEMLQELDFEISGDQILITFPRL